MRAALTLTRDSGNVQQNPTQNHESCEVLYIVFRSRSTDDKKGKNFESMSIFPIRSQLHYERSVISIHLQIQI